MLLFLIKKAKQISWRWCDGRASHQTGRPYGVRNRVASKSKYPGLCVRPVRQWNTKINHFFDFKIYCKRLSSLFFNGFASKSIGENLLAKFFDENKFWFAESAIRLEGFFSSILVNCWRFQRNVGLQFSQWRVQCAAWQTEGGLKNNFKLIDAVRRWPVTIDQLEANFNYGY